ncbi:TPA: MHC class I-like family A1, partial [Bos taurus]
LLGCFCSPAFTL